MHGTYTGEAGINAQPQVNPLDVYDDLRPVPYYRQAVRLEGSDTSAIYVRIRTAGGIEGLYGPIEKSAAIVVQQELRPFLLGKDALAGEALVGPDVPSNRHSRDGFFMMEISAVDNTLWDVRGRTLRARLSAAGRADPPSVEMYASCLGFSLEPEAVRTRALALKARGLPLSEMVYGLWPGLWARRYA